MRSPAGASGSRLDRKSRKDHFLNPRTICRGPCLRSRYLRRTTSASGGSAPGVVLSQPFRGQAGFQEHSDANGQVPVTALRRPGGLLTLWAIDHPTFVVPSDRRVMGLTHSDPNLHRATTVSGGEICPNLRGHDQVKPRSSSRARFAFSEGDDISARPVMHGD